MHFSTFWGQFKFPIHSLYVAACSRHPISHPDPCVLLLRMKFEHREPTLDILTKKWSETTKNSMRYDCLVLSPARQRRKIDEGVGGGGRVERESLSFPLQFPPPPPPPLLRPPAPTPSSISHLPARDWTRNNRISSSFRPFRTIYSLQYPVWAPCGLRRLWVRDPTSPETMV